MRKFVLLLMLLLSAGSIISQDIPKDVAFRLQQIKYIKNNYLPVEIEWLPREINTDYSEYRGELLPDSTFIYSSFVSVSDDDHEDIFEAYWMGKIYKSQLTFSGYSSPEPLNRNINNKNYYNVNFCFNEARNILFFTRCSKAAYPRLMCDIWKSELHNGDWQKPTKLPSTVNAPHANNTQPNWVEYENFNVLYFVSNRMDGEGELDIWFSIYKNGKFEEATNLGPIINTPGNEVTPFYNSKNKTLYFSSDEHLGIGGYDIHYSRGALSDWAEPSNMGVPFNSEYNDVYLTLNPNDNNGYFSSNRPNNKYSHKECCNDLYAYTWITPKDTLIPIPVVDTLNLEKQITQLIPLTLYFNNDEPDPKSTALTTQKNYRLTLANYIANKEVFKKEYSKGLSEKEQQQAIQNIEHFFTDSVQKGYAQLVQFSKILYTLLESGKSVSITVHGYASALHKTDYNFKLSSRRISSLINYLTEYENGALLPYLNGTKTNQLTIIEKPLGSQEAIAKNINANVHDKRNSVYSISASIERRIQVVSVTIQ